MLVNNVFISVGRKYVFKRRNAHRDLFDFIIACDTCSVQLNLESNITPRTLIVFLDLTICSFTLTDTSWTSLCLSGLNMMVYWTKNNRLWLPPKPRSQNKDCGGSNTSIQPTRSLSNQQLRKLWQQRKG